MRPMIPVYAALAMFAATQAGLAQTTPVAPVTAPPAASAPAVTPKAAKPSRIEQRFTAANTTHDGHLTLDQAKTAKMSSVVKHFATIDRGGKGYVTLDDLQTAQADARAAKAQQKAATSKS